MIQVFSSSKNIRVIFGIYYLKHLLVYSLYAIPLIYYSIKFNMQLITSAIFLFIMLFESYKTYKYCKSYLCEIVLEGNIIKLKVKDLFGDKGGVCRTYRSTDGMSTKISESILSISTGNAAYKLEFYQGKSLIFTQYPVGDWSPSMMKKVSSEFKKIEEERKI